MANRILLENGMEAEEAFYKDFPLEEYNENPFIQALPPLMNKETIVEKLMQTVSLKEEELQLDSSYRLHMVHRLFRFFQPLPIHIEIWNTIFSLIYQGYIARNPFNKDYKKYVNKTGNQIINKTFDLNTQSNFRTTASSAVLIGYSGMGKTTSVNRILSNIPQIIVHNQYKGQHFNQIQLSHLTLQTPHSSSVKALTLQAFMKIDELLGTNTFKKHVSRNLSVDAMLPLLGQVSHNIGLGLLVLDEIQHLQNRGMKQMMNYFVTLMNSFGVPVLFIGTPASYSIFQNEFRIARRVTGSGEIVWNNMGNNQEFLFLLESIWDFQWNKKFTTLTKEMINIFYEETQGVSDLMVKLFVNSQSLAIKSGKEEITINIVKKVAKEQFKFMRPMIEAIKSKNPYKIAQFEDLTNIKMSADNQMTNSKEQDSKRLVNKTNEVKQELVQSLPVKQKPKKIILYSENDIRQFKNVNKDGQSVYQLLLENGYVDDIHLWNDGVIE